MEATHLASLLPEIFRHKTSRIRVLKPQAILLDFHGTISERRWEEKIIYPYVKRSVVNYLKDNWQNNDVIQRCLGGLRNESFEQRFRHKYDDAPIIDEQLIEHSADASSSSSENENGAMLAQQMGEFLLWQMNTKRETRETQLIERLIWQDGIRRQKILTPLFEDVMSSIRTWHDQFKCSIYVVSSTDQETLKMLFENTNQGNLSQYLSGYVNLKKPGDKVISDTYKQFSDKISSNKSGHTTNSSTNHMSGTRILYLTDSGQEAKAANEASSNYECLLVNRPGNKRIRTYYLSQFQFISSFKDVEFV